MPNDRTVRPFYGLFPSLVEREGEEMIHDEGLLARFWGAWSDACMVCWNTMVADIANENPLASNILMSMWWPMWRQSSNTRGPASLSRTAPRGSQDNAPRVP